MAILKGYGKIFVCLLAAVWLAGCGILNVHCDKKGWGYVVAVDAPSSSLEKSQQVYAVLRELGYAGEWKESSKVLGTRGFRHEMMLKRKYDEGFDFIDVYIRYTLVPFETRVTDLKVEISNRYVGHENRAVREKMDILGDELMRKIGGEATIERLQVTPPLC